MTRLSPHAVRTILREELDEEGDLRIIAESAALPAPARTRATVGLRAPRTRDRAWRDNPRCIECDATIAHPADSGLVILDDRSHRVACKSPCFVRAIAKLNPTLSTTLSTATARGRAPSPLSTPRSPS